MVSHEYRSHIRIRFKVGDLLFFVAIMDELHGDIR